MNRSFSRRFLALLLGLALPAAAEVKDQTPWKISGQLEEACSCSAACPCWFNSLPTRMECSGLQVLFIAHGHYGTTKLDGLAIGMAGQSPEKQTMMESFGNWNFSYLYVDERATPEQRQALAAIGPTVLPAHAAPKHEVRYVPITRTISGKEHTIRLGPNCQFSGHLLEGGLGGPPRIANPPGADPIHREYLQGETTRLVYTDAGQEWDWKKTNYMFTEFQTDNAEYGKFMTGLAQKLAERRKTAVTMPHE